MLFWRKEKENNIAHNSKKPAIKTKSLAFIGEKMKEKRSIQKISPHLPWF
jgi:hypothetical protein